MGSAAQLRMKIVCTVVFASNLSEVRVHDPSPPFSSFILFVFFVFFFIILQELLATYLLACDFHFFKINLSIFFVFYSYFNFTWFGAGPLSLSTC